MPVSLKYPLGKNLGKTEHISRLFGRGGQPRLSDGRGEGGQPRLSETCFFCFFLSFEGFFGFGHFQPSAPLCTLAVRCLHAFKLAGTNRLTTAAMNILGLRIKTVCSNFEMFGHVLDNNLSFMLYFFEKHVA